MEKFNFEEAEKRLEVIKTELNSNNVKLDQVVSLIEEANKLIKYSLKYLEEAKSKISNEDN
ncbi:MAG: exodeoxyribonuclease VII small subunit [Mycoplasmataceae bacterium]|jgi:exodeoxyribonuclease VII small subunit|nr:exodeoxyribonuclease VII small subunit [Mycoplasmataceae bacterium]